jgi:ribokinase
MQLFVLGSFVQACCWQVPQAGETLNASAVHIEAGGKGLNVAIAGRRLGAQVHIALGLGKDYAALSLMALLDQEDVLRQHVHVLAAQSGYGAGLIAADGENSIAVYPGPNLLLNAEHMQQAQAEIATADLVYAQFETSLSAIHAAFSLAKQHGKTTVLNPSPWQTIPADMLQNSDILIVNEIEALSLFAITQLETELDLLIQQLSLACAAFYATWHGQCIVITLGKLGSLACSAHTEPVYCPAFEISAVDTVGAGDAFASGFCSAYLAKQPLFEALRFGNACGAMVASQLGVLDALPLAADVLQFIMNQSALQQPPILRA